MPKLKPLEDVSPEEDADAGAGYGRPARQQVRLRLAQAELRLQILGQEHDEPWIEERGILVSNKDTNFGYYNTSTYSCIKRGIN